MLYRIVSNDGQFQIVMCSGLIAHLFHLNSFSPKTTSS